MLKLNSLLLFSDNPRALIDFYHGVLDKEPSWSGGDFQGFEVGPGMLTIGPHDKVRGKNPNPERIIFNLETDDFEQEFERIKSLGATVIQEPYEPGESSSMSIATFADPDGNYFQLITPMM